MLVLQFTYIRRFPVLYIRRLVPIVICSDLFSVVITFRRDIQLKTTKGPDFIRLNSTETLFVNKPASFFY